MQGWKSQQCKTGIVSSALLGESAVQSLERVSSARQGESAVQGCESQQSKAGRESAAQGWERVRTLSQSEDPSPLNQLMERKNREKSGRRKERRPTRIKAWLSS